MVLIILAGLVTWLSLYLVYGREYAGDNPPEYVPEPPGDWWPNEVAYLWYWGHLGPQEMSATLFDLVRRGALRLVETVEDQPILLGLLGERHEKVYVIERPRDAKEHLLPSEEYLIKDILMLSPGERISLHRFQQLAYQQPAASHQRFLHWNKLAEFESERIPLQDPASARASGYGTAIGGLMLVSSFLYFWRLQVTVGMILFFCSMLLWAASRIVIGRRSKEAAKALHQWQGFRRYLQDFSRLDQYPPPAVILWERYLVYAVTLGIADDVIRQFQALYPQVAEHAASSGAFANWSTSEGSPFSGADAPSGTFSSISSTISAVASAFYSSSGIRAAGASVK
jgi:hypothetical protein